MYFDLEGTGVDPLTDRVVEIHAELIENGGRTVLSTRVNPGVPIPPDSTEIHGIRDEDVANAPRFRDIAERVQAMVSDAVLVGYSSRKYDVPLIDAELRRAGQPGLPRDARGRFATREIDLYEVWCQSEPRSLVGAARRFAGRDIENAHSAGDDAAALPAVMLGMIYAFRLGPPRASGADWWPRVIETLIERSRPKGALDRDGKFVVREDGVVVFNFGQSKGRPVSGDAGLLEWMLRKDFSAETKAIAVELLEQVYRYPEVDMDPEDANDDQGVLL